MIKMSAPRVYIDIQCRKDQMVISHAEELDKTPPAKERGGTSVNFWDKTFDKSSPSPAGLPSSPELAS